MMAFLCLVMFAFLLTAWGSNGAKAQNSYQNLILSTDHDQHYLSPYLLRYPENNEITNAYDILTKKSLKRELINDKGSILLFKINDETTWFSFDVVNRSKQEKWILQTGDQYQGKFGLFNSITVYSFDRETSKLKEIPFNNGNNINIELSQNNKTRVILKFEKPKGAPITTPLYLTKSTYITETNNLDLRK